MNIKKIGLMVLSAFVLTGILTTTTHAASVTPVLVNPWQSGDAQFECSQLNGTYQYPYKIDNWSEDTGGSYTATFDDGHSNTITISNNDGTYFDWSASPNTIGAVIVKGGNAANVFYYNPQVSSDTQLYSPTNPSGRPAAVSHATFCWNLDPVEEEAQWCSPGYWRQTQHLGSWVATGYKPEDAYTGPMTFNLNKKTRDLGLTTSPTLWQVLQYPQVYGGEAFNNVGDMLSEAHPDINFTGERVEDSCPLGRSL